MSALVIVALLVAGWLLFSALLLVTVSMVSARYNCMDDYLVERSLQVEKNVEDIQTSPEVQPITSS